MFKPRFKFTYDEVRIIVMALIEFKNQPNGRVLWNVILSGVFNDIMQYCLSVLCAISKLNDVLVITMFGLIYLLGIPSKSASDPSNIF